MTDRNGGAQNGSDGLTGMKSTIIEHEADIRMDIQGVLLALSRQSKQTHYQETGKA
jgi:hypothetical protein